MLSLYKPSPPCPKLLCRFSDLNSYNPNTADACTSEVGKMLLPVNEGLKMMYVNKSSKDRQLLLWHIFLEG
jgi:hypothetical protein